MKRLLVASIILAFCQCNSSENNINIQNKENFLTIKKRESKDKKVVPKPKTLNDLIKIVKVDKQIRYYITTHFLSPQELLNLRLVDYGTWYMSENNGFWREKKDVVIPFSIEWYGSKEYCEFYFDNSIKSFKNIENISLKAIPNIYSKELLQGDETNSFKEIPLSKHIDKIKNIEILYLPKDDLKNNRKPKSKLHYIFSNKRFNKVTDLTLREDIFLYDENIESYFSNLRNLIVSEKPQAPNGRSLKTFDITQCKLFELSSDLVLYIFEFLHFFDLMELSQTSKEFYKWINTPNEIWVQRPYFIPLYITNTNNMKESIESILDAEDENWITSEDLFLAISRKPVNIYKFKTIGIYIIDLSKCHYLRKLKLNIKENCAFEKKTMLLYINVTNKFLDDSYQEFNIIFKQSKNNNHIAWPKVSNYCLYEQESCYYNNNYNLNITEVRSERGNIDDLTSVDMKNLKNVQKISCLDEDWVFYCLEYLFDRLVDLKLIIKFPNIRESIDFSKLNLINLKFLSLELEYEKNRINFRGISKLQNLEKLDISIRTSKSDPIFIKDFCKYCINLKKLNLSLYLLPNISEISLKELKKLEEFSLNIKYSKENGCNFLCITSIRPNIKYFTKHDKEIKVLFLKKKLEGYQSNSLVWQGNL